MKVSERKQLEIVGLSGENPDASRADSLVGDARSRILGVFSDDEPQLSARRARDRLDALDAHVEPAPEPSRALGENFRFVRRTESVPRDHGDDARTGVSLADLCFRDPACVPEEMVVAAHEGSILQFEQVF